MKEIINNSIESNRITPLPNQFQDVPGWSVFHKIFQHAAKENLFSSKTFGTFGVDGSQNITDSFNEMIAYAESVHPLQAKAVLSIVHFLSANDNNIPEEASQLYAEFREVADQIPPSFEQYMIPTRHSDPVDGLYIQCTGSAKWTAYYENETESFILSPGDAIFIPKGIEHTVETLEPRAAISIGLA